PTTSTSTLSLHDALPIFTVPSWFVPLWSPSSSDTLGQLLRPFPQFSSIDTLPLQNAGQSTYNALQAKVERRFRNGLNLLASYTLDRKSTRLNSSHDQISY